MNALQSQVEVLPQSVYPDAHDEAHLHLMRATMSDDFAANASTIVEVLRYRAQQTPNQRAFTFLEGGERETSAFTFGGLDRRARAIASRLTSLGVSGKQVLLLHPPGLEFVASFFGCLYAGAVAVPGYSWLLSERNLPRLQSLIADSDAKLIVTNSDSFLAFHQSIPEPEHDRLPAVLASDTIQDEEETGWSVPDINSDAPAYIQYTSGSTSEPRGVVLHHSNVIYNQQMIRCAFGNAEGLSLVNWLPHAHDMGLVGIVQQTVFAGLTTVMMSPLEFIRKPVRWLRAISKYRAYASAAPNFGYELCVERIKTEDIAGLDLSCWKRACNGSEPVRAETLARFSAKFASCGFREASFYPCYGMAEATLFVTGRADYDQPIVRNVEGEALARGCFAEASVGTPGSRRFVSCGRAWGDERILIVNPETRTRCSLDSVGEIWVSGSHVAAGYWNRVEKNREIFNAYLADTGEGPFLRTGDSGCIYDGELYITGRLKDLIIIRGRNYYPQDIEAAVAAAHPALRSGCGAAFSIDVDGQEKIAVVQEVTNRTPSEKVAEIRVAIHQTLAEEHAIKPHAIILLRANTIPKTPSGKVRRYACRMSFLENSLREELFG